MKTNLKKRFKDLSLKKKLLLFYGVLFILPLLLISVIIYVEVSNSMLEKIQFSAAQGYEQSKSYLEFKILELIQRTDVVVTNSSLKEKIGEGNIPLPDVHEQLVQKDAIRGYLQSVESSTQSIRIRLFISDVFALMMDGEHIMPLSEADNALWYQKKGTQKVYFAPGAYLEEGRKEEYIALVRDIPEEDNYRRRNSILRMDIRIEELAEILRNATPTENAVTYLVNRENLIIGVSDRGKLEMLGLSEELPEEFRYSRYASESDLQETRLEQQVIYCMRNKIRNTDWEMITVIPKTDMINGIARLQYIVAGLMILFGLLTIAGGTFIISWIVRRISRLNDTFNQVKEGDTETYLPNDHLSFRFPVIQGFHFAVGIEGDPVKGTDHRITAYRYPFFPGICGSLLPCDLQCLVSEGRKLLHISQNPVFSCRPGNRAVLIQKHGIPFHCAAVRDADIIASLISRRIIQNNTVPVHPDFL